MGKVNDYAFINAKLRARLGQMKESHLFDDMIKASSLSEAMALLKDTRHSSLSSVYEATGDLEQVELSLLEEEISTYREICSYLKGEARKVVEVLLEKTECENLKNAFRLWYSMKVRNHSMTYRASYIYKGEIVHKIDYDRIINSRTYDDVLSALLKTPYYDVFRKFTIEDLSESGLFFLEIALDHLFFDHLFSECAKLSPEDREEAEMIYNVDVDLKNILLYIRYAFYHHLGADDLEKVLIPYGYIYQHMHRAHIFSLPGKGEEKVRSIVAARYGDLLDEIDAIRKGDDELTGSDENASHILAIENYLANTRKKEYARILRGKPFSIGVPLSYLYSYKDDERILRAILSAKSYGWREDKIREALK